MSTIFNSSPTKPAATGSLLVFVVYFLAVASGVGALFLVVLTAFGLTIHYWECVALAALVFILLAISKPSK